MSDPIIDMWREGFKDENHYFTNEGYPLGTTCHYVYLECAGMRHFACAETIEAARGKAAVWAIKVWADHEAYQERNAATPVELRTKEEM